MNVGKISKKNLRRLEHGLPPLQSEDAFQTQVIQYAQMRGWRCAHFRPSLNQRGKWQTAVQADGAGFVDLVLVRNNRCLFVELKSETGVLSDEQELWIKALKLAMQHVFVWRPRNWQEIMEELE